jgi:hypothetical protein
MANIGAYANAAKAASSANGKKRDEPERPVMELSVYGVCRMTNLLPEYGHLFPVAARVGPA